MIGNSLRKGIWLAFGLSVALAGRASSGDMKYETVFETDFSGNLDAWRVEQQEGGSVAIKEGKLVIADKKGCTVWYDRELEGPVRISYTVTVSSVERVSDMNCFWMARDPDHESDLFAEGHGREGAFAQYDDLSLYYVGYGGNHNSTTRFRRYLGKGVKPLLEGYDLRDEAHLLKADHAYRIELVADESGARYFRDGELIFEYADPEPLLRGWFGFRTVWSHLEIDDFKVERILKTEDES